MSELTPVGEHQGRPIRRTPPTREQVYGRNRRLPAWLNSDLRRHEQSAHRQLALAAAHVTRQNIIAVIGPPGGAGKTTTAYCVGAAIAEHSRLNVIVVDVDDDYGALTDLAPDITRSRRSLSDLIAQDRTGPVPFPELRQFLSTTPSGMSILAGDRSIADYEDLDRMLGLLANAEVVILDCAPGIKGRAEWAMHRADQRIVVVRGDLAGASRTAERIEEAVPREHSWLVINKIDGGTSREKIRIIFGDCGLTDPIEIPASSTLKQTLARAVYRLDRLPRPVRVPIAVLAARVAATLE